MISTSGTIAPGCAVIKYMKHEIVKLDADKLFVDEHSPCEECLSDNTIGHCKYCMKDLCGTCAIRWKADIYGNEIEKPSDYLIVCKHCTKEADKVVVQIKDIREMVNRRIQEIVLRFQFRMTEEREKGGN